MTQNNGQQGIDLKLNDLFALRNLEVNLLDELKLSYESEAAISDDLLESFYFLYKNPLFEALNQIDKYIETGSTPMKAATAAPVVTKTPLVTLIKCERSNHQLYRVKGSMDVYYYLFDDLNFCTCSSFKYNVLNRFEYFYCKHIVMVKLLVAMKRVNEMVVKESEMTELIQLIQ